MPPRRRTFECRFCLEPDVKTALITPCRCIGSIAYVHSNCLLRWYHTNPEAGLRCSICKEELAKEVLFPLELGFGQQDYITAGLSHPFLTIFIWHWFYLFLLGAFYQTTQQALVMPLYIALQIGFHTRFAVRFIQYSSAIQGKSRYWRAWRSRAGLIGLHLLFLALFPELKWVAGIAADLCCIQVLQTHFQIVAELNTAHSFQFVSRRPPQRPSLESS